MSRTVILSDDVHFSLPDIILNSAALNIAKSQKDPLDVSEIRNIFISELNNAEKTLSFSELDMSIQLASNLSSHEKDPFVHTFTSMLDQGTGSLGLLYKQRNLIQEEVYSSSSSSALYKKTETIISKNIISFENNNGRESYFKDGTIQVPLGKFFYDKEYGAMVSEISQMSIFVPNVFYDEQKRIIKDKNSKTKYRFDDKYRADSTIYFQIHSKSKNSEGKDCYQLTGTGKILLSKIVSECTKHINENLSRSGGIDKHEEVSIEVPLVLNSVSSQSPEAKVVDHISSNELSEGKLPESLNEKLYQGSIFVHLNLNNKETYDFFYSFISSPDKFHKISSSDVTDGNFPFMASRMRTHILRDMSPFISSFTKSFSVTTRKINESEDEKSFQNSSSSSFRRYSHNRKKSIAHPHSEQSNIQEGWVFEPSLPEGSKIHAPYNKGNTHTPPGFTYYHDRAMQRLPNTEFLVHISNIVLNRHRVDPKDFVHTILNPVGISTNKSSRGKNVLLINPDYPDALKMVAEMTTCFSTSMNYRGDYADMNTDLMKTEGHLQRTKKTSLFDKHHSIHYIEHITGMTRVPAGKRKWNPTKKQGTEMFGDSIMDQSADCEDDEKLIARMIAGYKACNTSHPTILAVKNVLNKYVTFAVLSSVTSRNIKEAPSTSNEKREINTTKNNFPFAHSGVKVGSPEDIKAGIGAHMWGLLLPKKMTKKAFEATSSSNSPLGENEDELLLSSSSHSLSFHEKKLRSHEEFLQEWLPPLILEGTGPSDAFILASEHVYRTVDEKAMAINKSLRRLEAVSRLMTTMPSDQVTVEAIRSSQDIFKHFTLPIETNKIIDLDRNERPSPFYRMAGEMFHIKDGNTDNNVVPYSISSIQKEINSLTSLKETIDISSLKLTTDEYTKNTKESGEDKYFMSRIIPVQLGPRDSSNKLKYDTGYTYGINVTDFVHKTTDNIGLLKTIRSSHSEKKIISSIMRHAPSSPFIHLAPGDEQNKARKIASSFYEIINENVDRTLSRGFMGRDEDIFTVHIYVRTDAISNRDILKLANHLSNNPYVGQAPVEVVPESFSRGHHLIRISVPVDVTGVKQLYFERNDLSERLNTPSYMTLTERAENEKEMNTYLVKKLKKIFS